MDIGSPPRNRCSSWPHPLEWRETRPFSVAAPPALSLPPKKLVISPPPSRSAQVQDLGVRRGVLDPGSRAETSVAASNSSTRASCSRLSIDNLAATMSPFTTAVSRNSTRPMHADRLRPAQDHHLARVHIRHQARIRPHRQQLCAGTNACALPVPISAATANATPLLRKSLRCIEVPFPLRVRTSPAPPAQSSSTCRF